MTRQTNDSVFASMSRRSILASVAAIGVATVSAGYVAAQQPATPAVLQGIGDPLGTATMPGWELGALRMDDPYTGKLSKPDGLPAGIRVVGLEVVIINNSDQPLEFSVTDIRLRDTQGTEYRAGDFLGTEPRLVSQNLPDGERSRGWVWYGLASSVEVASIVFVAPPPILRIDLG